MNYICPQPQKWNEIYLKLLKFQEKSEKEHVPSPPKPLILNGWIFSNDYEKRVRWKETVDWINKYYDSEILCDINKNDKYFG